MFTDGVRAAKAVRTGADLALDGAVGRRTWEEFLAGHVAGSSSGSDDTVSPAGPRG